MSNIVQPVMCRRAFVVGATSFAAGAAVAPMHARATEGATEFKLNAKPGGAALVGPPHPDTAVWTYNGSVPGPVLTLQQGDRIRVVVKNDLTEETTVHWHGIRLPAPPHDATGHTWHHPDGVLLRITRDGPAAVVGDGYESDMPGFGGILTDPEMRSILEYFKSTWPERERLYQAEMTRREEERQ